MRQLEWKIPKISQIEIPKGTKSRMHNVAGDNFKYFSLTRGNPEDA